MADGFDLAVAGLFAGIGLATILGLILIWAIHEEIEAIATQNDASDHPLFIAMPDHLKTREEMVTWMTGEMPKLTEELTRGRL